MSKHHARTKVARRPAKRPWTFPDPPPAAADAGTGAGTGTTEPPPAADAGNGEKTLTQTQVNAIVARESQAARDKATSELATQLGVSIEEAKSIIKAHTDKSDAEKSEAQRAREAADAEKAAAAKERAEAAQEKHNTWADRELIKAGVTLPAKEEDQDPALSRIRGLLTVQVGASAAEIAADVKAVKELYPALFTGAAGGKTPPPGSDPKTPPGGGSGTGGQSGIERGMAKARERYAKKEDNRPLPAGQRK